MSDAVFVFCIHSEAVYDQFDIMYLKSVELHLWFDLYDLTIDTYLQIALLAYIFEKFTIVAFSPSHDGGEDHYFLSLVIGQEIVDDLLLGELHHLLARDI